MGRKCRTYVPYLLHFDGNKIERMKNRSNTTERKHNKKKYKEQIGHTDTMINNNNNE